jgi:serine/threonine protein kinase
MKPGDLVDNRFVVERLAGTGGMGSVFRALDRQTQRIVAIKTLHDPGGNHVERFLREAQVLMELQHPHIVAYVGHGKTAKGELYMAMEWVDGESLSERIAARPLSVREALRVVIDVASALAVAHAHGIVHRDIKPSNLQLVKGTLDIKVLDFGIARLTQSAGLTGKGMMLGTPGYMAPEQIKGSPNVDARADVFSLGCVLFKCLAGRPPFLGDDLRVVLSQVMFDPAPPVSSLRPEVSPALDAVVARMLSKKAEERPADGAAVAAILTPLLAQALDLPGLVHGGPGFDRSAAPVWNPGPSPSPRPPTGQPGPARPPSASPAAGARPPTPSLSRAEARPPGATLRPRSQPTPVVKRAPSLELPTVASQPGDLPFAPGGSEGRTVESLPADLPGPLPLPVPVPLAMTVRAPPEPVSMAEAVEPEEPLEPALARLTAALPGLSGLPRGHALLEQAGVLLWLARPADAARTALEAMGVCAGNELAQAWALRATALGVAGARTDLLTLAQQVPDAPLRSAGQLAVAAAAADALWSLGEAEAARRLDGRVREAARALGLTPAQRARLLAQLARWGGLHGDGAAARRGAQGAAAQLRAAGLRREACRVALEEAAWRVWLGLAGPAIEAADAALDDAGADPGPWLLAEAALVRAEAQLAQDAPEAARGEAIGALAAAGPGRAPALVGRAHLAMARALELSAPEDAEVEARKALEALQGTPLASGAQAAMARLRLAAGAVAPGLQLAKTAVAALTAECGAMAEPEARLTLAQALFAAGLRDAGRDALALARDRLLAQASAIDNEQEHRTFLTGVPTHAKLMQLAEWWLGAVPSI